MTRRRRLITAAAGWVATARGTGAPPRFALLDAARGAAVVGMVLYHAVWDLALVGVVPWSLVDTTGSHAARSLVLMAFLLLAGIGGALAVARGRDRAVLVHRTTVLAGWAGVLTLGSWLVDPALTIWFGVIHLLALAGVIGWVLCRTLTPDPARAVAILLAALCVLAHERGGAAFEAPALAWLGLGVVRPVSLDFVPVAPWFAAYAAGIAIGSRWIGHGLPWRVETWRPRSRATAALTWVGRHALALYLVHQPALLAMAFGARELAGALGR